MDKGGKFFRGRAAGTIVVGIALACGLIAAPAGAEVSNGEAFVPGEVIVRYATGTSASDRSLARRRADVEVGQQMLLPRTQLVETGSGQSVDDAIKELENNNDVLYAEPNWLENTDAVPNDTEMLNLWGLSNTGQTISGPSGNFTGIPGDDMDALLGWDIGRTSKDTLTAVIDSGITAAHPEFSGRLWSNPGETAGNGVDDDNNGLVDDVRGWDFVNNDNDPSDGAGHGTHVAGTIGAAGNNGQGVTGVSWDASLVSLKVCRSIGGCPVAATVDAITYAANQGVKVANMSLGGTAFSQARRDAIAAAPNVLFVVSSGNEGTDTPNFGDNEGIPKYPCQDDQVTPANAGPALPNLICVANSDWNDAKTASSNFGLTSVDLAAPGRNIRSTWPSLGSVFNDTFDGPVKFNYTNVPVIGAGTWENGPTIGSAGGRGVADSLDTTGGDIPYLPSSTATMTSQEISLGGLSGCGLQYNFRLSSQSITGSDLSTGDVLYVEARSQDDPAWTTLDAWSGGTGGAFVSSVSRGSQATLETFNPNKPLSIRFRFAANFDATVSTGARIDDVYVVCAGPVGVPQYNYLTGTSMSTPQVTGIASIVRDLNPGLNPSQVKAKILGGVDPNAAFSTAGPTPVVTGGRANLKNTLASLDLTPPTLPTLGAPEGLVNTARPQFSWNAVEAGTKYELLLDGQVIFTSLGQTDFIPTADLAPGEHSWTVRVTDQPGNDVETAARTFTYAPDGAVKVLSAKPIRDRRGGTILRIRVSEPGMVKALGSAKVKVGRKKKVRIVSQTSALRQRAETFTLRMRPGPLGKKALRGKRKIPVKIKVTFRPTLGGKAATATLSTKLGAPVKKKKR